MKPHIPQPCHEDWNLMTPKEKGRFCGVCAKVVVDFTKMTDIEILDYLQQHTKQKTCGHFRNEQLLQKQKIHIDLTTLPKNIPFKNIFVACFISFFSALFFISCNGKNNEITSGVIEIVDSTQMKSSDALKKCDTSKLLLKTHHVPEQVVETSWTGGTPAIPSIYGSLPEPEFPPEPPIVEPFTMDTNKMNPTKKNTDMKIIQDTAIYQSDAIK